MNATEIIEQIAEKDFDPDWFVHLAIQDESVRTEIIHQMLTNPDIMVYYHSYYIIEKASREEPGLFNPYWDRIVPLLQHKNSYHRDFALEIIGNLVAVDTKDLFSLVRTKYFSLVNDPKFMTGNCCLKNLRKIYQHKPALREVIFEMLVGIDTHCDYSEKQKGLLKADVLEILDEIYAECTDQKRIDEFIRAQSNSISPKTRKLAKELMVKYSLGQAG